MIAGHNDPGHNDIRGTVIRGTMTQDFQKWPKIFQSSAIPLWGTTTRGTMPRGTTNRGTTICSRVNRFPLLCKIRHEESWSTFSYQGKVTNMAEILFLCPLLNNLLQNNHNSSIFFLMTSNNNLKVPLAKQRQQLHSIFIQFDEWRVDLTRAFHPKNYSDDMGGELLGVKRVSALS